MNLGTLDLVSIVPWEIVTQLINLLLLFLLLKHFLFKPVQNILNARQAEIDKTQCIGCQVCMQMCHRDALTV